MFQDRFVLNSSVKTHPSLQKTVNHSGVFDYYKYLVEFLEHSVDKI